MLSFIISALIKYSFSRTQAFHFHLLPGPAPNLLKSWGYDSALMIPPRTSISQRAVLVLLCALELPTKEFTPSQACLVVFLPLSQTMSTSLQQWPSPSSHSLSVPLKADIVPFQSLLPTSAGVVFQGVKETM